MAQFNFDASQHASAPMNFDALPKGWYQAKLVESKVRATTAGGQALDFVAEILAPAFAKGRKVFLGFNVVHPTSEDAVRIGFEQLASLSLAVGVPQWAQTEQLHEKPFHIKLKIEKAPEGSDYEDRNQPNGYDMISTHRALAVQVATPNTAAPSAPFPGAPVAPAAAPAIPSAPPAAQLPQTPPPAAAPAAPAQPWANANPQPWEQPAAPAAVAPQAPVQPPVEQQVPAKSPEQLAWEAQQAAQAAPQVPQQPAPAQQPAQPAQPEQTQQAVATPPWAAQTATPAPQQAAPAQAAQAPAEPPHPAQSQVPPWQQPSA